MGLIDLKTDLKSLRYGKDTIGGGYSGQPYIQTPIPDSFNDLGANEDFILRGGVNAIGDAATDVRRLTKMFFDLKSPNGVLFIAKQNLLSQTAVRTQTSDAVNEGIYTPLNTLAQAGVVELGGHLNKQGVNPFIETGAYANSEILYSVKVKPTQAIESNRLAELYRAVTTDRSITNWNFSGFDLNTGANVLSYNGGPNSILGAGQTNVRYSTFRTGKQNPSYTANPNFFTGKNNQKSIDADDKQVGGLSIDSQRSWTKGEIIFTGLGKQFYFNELPDFTPNTPQSSSFIQAYDGQANYNSSQAKQNISGSTDGGKYDLYNPLRYAGISAYESIYRDLLGVYGVESGSRDLNGNTTWFNKVYQPGTLEPYTPNLGSSTWTPKPIDFFPTSSTYLLSSRTSINYNVSGSKGVTNFIKIPLTTFVNPSVYQTGSTFPLTPNTEKTDQNVITYTPQQISSSVSYYTSGKLIDFRKVIRESALNTTQADNAELSGSIVPVTYINYGDKNIGVKNLLGNPGNRTGKNYSNFSNGVTKLDGTTYKALDEINAASVGTDLSNNDLIPFRIQSLFTGGSTLVFRAFLGGITDSYTAGINSQQYVGRGENFYTYSGQTRKISLSWTVAALSREELLPMYKRLNYLASMTAPKYVNGFMQGPLVNLTVGGYIYNLPGYIEGFSLEIAEDSTWEIAIKPDGSPDDNISQLPHVIKVNGFNFTPIPNYLPEAGNAESRFISIVAPNGTSK